MTKKPNPTEEIKYLKQFMGKLIVIKYGGNAMIHDDHTDSVFEDIALLTQIGIKVVVVHGGGPSIDQEMENHGIERKFVRGLRVTDLSTMNIVARILKQINRQCVESLRRAGVEAQDCTDGTLLTKIKNAELGYVGDIVGVKKENIQSALDHGMVPIISSMGRDETGHQNNINADTVATKIAVALQAEKLTILTNVDGVLDAKGKLISHLSTDEAERLLASHTIHGGMIPKVRACVEAASHGVAKAHLLNGTRKRALLLEILTDKGIGTEVVS